MSRIEISAPEFLEGGEIRWVGRLVSPELDKPCEVFFQFTVSEQARFVPAPRTFLLAFLLPAMALGEVLELEGPVDDLTLINLMEWQRAFASAFPGLSVVEIVCRETELASPVEREGAICAFSGGVDSCFSALREREPHRGEGVTAGLMVHGFDIPLEQEVVFERAFQRSGDLLASQGKKSYRMKTNLREVTDGLGMSWPDLAHGIVLAAVLSCYESFFKEVVIPSTFSYTGFKFPWGSNPATDPYFSSRETRCVHDGTALNKYDKVKALAGLDAVRKGVRVCWEGESLDRNCGRCFKCVATQVCFWLCGYDKPEAFGEGCDLTRVSNLYFKKSVQNQELFRVYGEVAEQRGMKDLAQACRRACARQGLLYWRNRFNQRILRRKW